MKLFGLLFFMMTMFSSVSMAQQCTQAQISQISLFSGLDQTEVDRWNDQVDRRIRLEIVHAVNCSVDLGVQWSLSVPVKHAILSKNEMAYIYPDALLTAYDLMLKPGNGFADGQLITVQLQASNQAIKIQDSISVQIDKIAPKAPSLNGLVGYMIPKGTRYKMLIYELSEESLGEDLSLMGKLRIDNLINPTDRGTEDLIKNSFMLAGKRVLMFQALQEGDRVLVSRDTAGNVSMPSEIFNLSQLQEYTLNRKGELVLKKAR